MATQRCDACGDRVKIAGGIANLWTFEADRTGGIELVLADDSEHFLCFACMDRLPDDREVTAEDVADLKGSQQE